MLAFIIVVATNFWIECAFANYWTDGETCISIKGKLHTGQYSYGQIKCKDDKSVYVQRVWYDNERNCEYDQSQSKQIFNVQLLVSCDNISLCKVPFYRSYMNRNYQYLNLRFQCTECIPIHVRTTVRIICPANKSIVIDDIWDGSINCPAYRYPPQEMTNAKKTLYNRCNESPKCSMIYSSPIDTVTSIFYHCKAGSEISRNNSSKHVITTLTDSNIRSSYGSIIPGSDIFTESHDIISQYFLGGPDYAVVVGGIVGVLLVICVIVGVFHSSRRKCMIKYNETNDSTHDQSVPDNNQDGQLMNSPDHADVVHVIASHAVNVYNTTDSITYSHLRSTVNDADVMYDHTVRDNVHNTCDGDYGIAHRRITEDDYDVSGNYRTSHSNETDPVYN
ncbi:uncharacterized protein LOC143050883 [Mytilus galloprovincialis]|uniref:uncharacterized protein LOC143050883 n=1 Tax=Mytilus galloprovincialis TaxID=29158 RepID=UPI003F7B8CA1